MNLSFLKRLGYLILFTPFFSCQIEINAIQMAPVFSNHMVLQQQMEVPIWGSANPDTSIEIKASWGASAVTTTNKEGKWSALLQTPSYGGPYQIKIQSKKQTLVFEDVMIGEVWLASGQSNMEWQLQYPIKNQANEIANAKYPNIRMFSVPRNLNNEGIQNASWMFTTPENVKKFSAVAYFFARELNEKLNIPIGIVNSSWGGTRVEAWTSLEKLAALNPTQAATKKIIDAGGLQGIKEKITRDNLTISKSNTAFLKTKSYPYPEGDNLEKIWSALELDDIAFAASNHDDSNWDSFDVELQTSEDVKSPITFEQFYSSGSTAENGVVWYRKSFDVADAKQEYTLRFNKGIDDIDYTYINGVLVGNSLMCCADKIYEIPSGILKEKGNVLAIRVIDLQGEGGFRGSIVLESEIEKQRLDQGEWKQKHHAFYLYPKFHLHNFSTSELVANEAKLQANLKQGSSLNNPNDYSILFQKMIRPILPFGIRGVLWYQGESNVGNYEEYQELFTGMIEDWRERWGYEFPFYFAQIAPYIYDTNSKSQALRDAQRKSLVTPKTGMVVTLDIGDEFDIHPANKQDVGLRFANLALNNDYDQKKRVPSGPLYKKQRLFSNYIELEFDNIGSGLIAKNKLTGFEIAGANGNFFPANAKIINNTIQVSSRKVKNPKRARYGWKNYFEATLFNKEGLPASSFQTN